MRPADVDHSKGQAPATLALTERSETTSSPAPSVVTGREIDVWVVTLDSPAMGLAALSATLSTDEQVRADRFYFDRDRRRFIGARGVLRHLLGAYLEVPPVSITFGYGTYGKPALSGMYQGALKFNVSHSHGLALVAIGAVEMGVDVEAIRPMADANDIAARFFSPDEAAELRALPVALRDAAFFAGWTRKEAYLKALGSGLARPLDEFTVTLAPAAPVGLVVHSDQQEAARWSIRDLPLAGYAAALATEAGGGQVRYRAWTDPATRGTP